MNDTKKTLSWAVEDAAEAAGEAGATSEELRAGAAASLGIEVTQTQAANAMQNLLRTRRLLRVGLRKDGERGYLYATPSNLGDRRPLPKNAVAIRETVEDFADLMEERGIVLDEEDIAAINSRFHIKRKIAK